MKPVLAEIRATHDCPFVYTTEKQEGIILGVDAWNTPKGLEFLGKVRANNMPELIRAFKKQPSILNVEVILEKNDEALAIFKFNTLDTFHDLVNRSGCIIIEPSVSTGGTDTVSVLAPTHKQLKNMFDLMDESYDAQLLKKKFIDINDVGSVDALTRNGFLELQCMSNSLTDRQKEMFELACKSGYYSTPKKVTFSDMAKELGVSEKAARTHLRLAEGKIMPAMRQMMELF